SSRTRLESHPGRGFRCSTCGWRFNCCLQDGRIHIRTCKGLPFQNSDSSRGSDSDIGAENEASSAGDGLGRGGSGCSNGDFGEDARRSASSIVAAHLSPGVGFRQGFLSLSC
ncbi:unnamed protein product, partial [Pylaiella littoralis]